MALLWMDGFDHYETGANGRSQMQDGPWAELPASGGPSTEQARSGTKSLEVDVALDYRRVLGVTTDVAGIGGAFYFDDMPSVEGGHILYSFRDQSNVELARVELQTTGAIRVVNGQDELLFETTAPQVTAAAWQHIEAMIVVHATVGACEVRVNSIAVLNVTNVDTLGAGNVNGCAQIAIRHGQGIGDPLQAAFFVDDLFAWDDSGSFNNDFIGDRRVLAFFPDADTSSADYLIIGAASGFGAIDDATPNDETDYLIYEPISASVEAVGEFGVEALPTDVVAISAVQTYVRARKTEPGLATLRSAMVSTGDVALGDLHSITSEWTYWTDVFETDPDTGAPWTRTALAIADLRISRED